MKYHHELLLLACIVVEPKVVMAGTVGMGMTEQWFEDYEAGRVYGAWHGLWNGKAMSDCAMLAVTPQWILQEIELCVAHAVDWQYYARIIRDRWTLRRLHMLAYATARDAQRALQHMDVLSPKIIEEAISNLRRVERGEETHHEYASRLSARDIDSACNASTTAAYYRGSRQDLPGGVVTPQRVRDAAAGANRNQASANRTKAPLSSRQRDAGHRGNGT